MKGRNICVTRLDFERLTELIQREERKSGLNRPHLKELNQELKKAQKVPSQEIPDHVITMNSRIKIRSEETQDTLELTLVYPEEADMDQGKISVLAPVGTALLGYSEGDRICWEVPGGIRFFTVEKMIYQPEASGDFNL